jgi:hypothetical protein
MAIIQSMCTSFKLQLLSAVHDFSNHVFKLALYTNVANLGPATTSYTEFGEVAGSGYTAGGLVVVATPPSIITNVAMVNFSDVSWPEASFTARGALIYNSSVSGNPSVVVLDFGADKVVSNDTFGVTFPAKTADGAIVRIF